MAAVNFDWIDLPDPRLRGYVIEAVENDQDCEIPDFLGSVVLFSDCADWITREAKVITALQGYRLVHTEKAGILRRRFVFAPNLSREDAHTAFRSYYDTEPSMFWPPVLLTIKGYKRLDESYVARPRYKNAYQGPTRVRIEEFFSPVEFNLPLYEPMIEQGVDDEVGYSFASGGTTYYVSLGPLNLIPCLHAAISIAIPLDPTVTIGMVTIAFATLSVNATNYTDWPDELVIDDRQRQVLGGFVRRRVTALRPMIVRVTLPTSASVTSTTATLGGTVAIEDNAIVTERGVVYAPTASDPNTELGNSAITSATTAGTTGLFTLGVTGLTAATPYSFKAYAMTSQGVAVYSTVGTFTTSA